MEPEGSLPHSQVPVTCPYPEPARSSPYPHIPLPEYPSSYYPPTYGWVSFPSGFPTKTPHLPLLSPIRATFPANLILLDFITRPMLVEAWYWTTNEKCTLFIHLHSSSLSFSSDPSHHSPFLFSTSFFQPSFLLYLPFILHYFYIPSSSFFPAFFCLPP